MCTLTWRSDGSALELRFNRDELHSRAEAEPPRIFAGAARRWLAPLDPDGGGTWLGANDAGLVVALLNGYRGSDDSDKHWRSRGLLVVELLQLDGSEAVLDRLRATDLGMVRSFQLWIWSGGAAHLVHWDGGSLAHEQATRCATPLTSSSRDPQGATRERAALLERLRAKHGETAEAERLFHASHEPARGPTSPCMHRDDACTRSHALLRVDPARIEFQYHAASPCQVVAPVIAHLDRAPTTWN